MIERYTRPQMGKIWSEEVKFDCMRQVEVAVAQAQAELGLIPKKAAQDIAKKAKFTLKRILEIEKTTHHDVVAFVSAMAEKTGSNGRYIHYGLTSSDVLDTSTSLRVRQADKEFVKSLARLEKSLRVQIKKHESTLCAGRTHGMHAEPTSFGLKLAGFLAELLRNKNRYKRAIEQMQICKLSGAVGTYSAEKSLQVEKKVCALLKLQPEVIATQVIPRDRHAELVCALAFLGCSIERLSIELRHLQRTEVNEAVEGFSKGQKGSSAMPHKKNPISAENLTGVARMLRAYSQASMENIALWHERDISHSSVERVFFADAFIICDYAIDRMATVIENLQVNAKQMLINIEISQGQIFSSHVLSSLIKKGVLREKAYQWIQSCSHKLKSDENLRDKLKAHKEVSKILTSSQIDEIFSGKVHKQAISKVIKRVL